MRLIILFINILALCRCAFSVPIDKKQQNNIDNNDDDFDNEVEEMRKKLEEWSLSKQRKKVENIRNYDDHDSDQRTIIAVNDHQHWRKKTNEKQDKRLAELQYDPESLVKDKQGEASGSNKSGNNRRHNYQHHKSKSSDPHRRSTELHSISRRHSADSINESRDQRRRSKDKQLSESPVNRKNKQIVPIDWKKPPPSPDRNQNKHIAPYKQKSIVLRRKEESVEDLQKIQNEMSAIIAQTMDNQKGMRDEAYALQIASNVQPTNIEVIRPKRPQLMARLSRKMRPEPEKWKRNLAKTFEHEFLPSTSIELDRKQAAFSNSYHGYWGDDYSPPKSEKLPCVDQSAQNSQLMLEAPSAGKLEQACSSHGDQTPLYLMEGTSTHVGHNDNEVIIHHRSSSSSSDDFVHRTESDTDLDRERSPSPSQRHYSIDQHQRSLRRKSVKKTGSKSVRIKAGSDEDLSKSKIKAFDQNSSTTNDQRRIYSRRATFYGSSTSSDQFQRQRTHYGGSTRADDLKLKETADQDDLSKGLCYEGSTIRADQDNTEDDAKIFDLDELEEEAAVRVAMKHSLEEAEKIKREDEEQLRIAMEHSVMDEIQKRKNRKKGALEKLKSLIPRPPQLISNNSKRASSSENRSSDNDNDSAFQKALRDSIHDQK